MEACCKDGVLLHKSSSFLSFLPMQVLSDSKLAVLWFCSHTVLNLKPQGWYYSNDNFVYVQDHEMFYASFETVYF